MLVLILCKSNIVRNKHFLAIKYSLTQKFIDWRLEVKWLPRKKLKIKTCTKYLLTGHRQQVFQYLDIMRFHRAHLSPIISVVRARFCGRRGKAFKYYFQCVLFSSEGNGSHENCKIWAMLLFSYANFYHFRWIITLLRQLNFNISVLQTRRQVLRANTVD